MRYLGILMLISLSVTLWAGDIKYPVFSIPASLSKNAAVVKRAESIEFEVVKLDETYFRRKVVLTIMNEMGERQAALVVNYDKLRKVVVMEGNLYDAQGALVKKAKNKDIQDYSAVSDISLYDDNRVKVLDFNYHNYPYTVEYEVVIRYNNTYSFPDWYPQSAYRQAVESSMYTLITPDNYQVRYKAFNYKGEPEVSTEKNKKRMTWKASNLPVVKSYAYAPLWQEMTTSVLFSPSEFEMDGFKGTALNWNEFGKFFLALNAGRDKLPEPIVQKVKELTAGVSDDKEKVRILYQFLQQNTRYISIQLGIGGLQPFEASFVAQKGYGDCKALSNYMYGLLEAAGIKSYHALVKGGDDADDKFLLEDFPRHYFNHMILSVPFPKDTMWLECTSQTESAGYMGSFTGNRKALLITEDGGKLVSTPRYGMQENREMRTVKAKMQEDGTLTLNSTTVYKGLRQDGLGGMVDHYSKDDVKKYLQQELELATYEVNGFKYDQKKSSLPELTESLDITVNGYANISGKRIFIVPNILSRGGMKLTEEERIVDFVFDDEFHNEDAVDIEIPEGFEIESAPQDLIIKTKYGTYSCTTKLEGNKIIYRRVREQFSGRFPAKEQADIIKFFTDIYKSDRTKLVLVRKG